MQIISAIDSMKGSLTSITANKIVGEVFSDTETTVEQIAVADGGEGTVDAFVTNCAGEYRHVACHDLLGHEMRAPIGWLAESQTAIIESASVCGIKFLDKTVLTHPLNTSTKGLGELISVAIKMNAKRIIIGLGGTGTVDGGMGALAYLGMQFFDNQQNILEGKGHDLGQVATLSSSNLLESEIEIIVMADVRSSLTGATGAVEMFGPQKGIRDDEIADYEKMMLHYEQVLLRGSKGRPGDGAAGGLGFGLRIGLKAKLVDGFDFLAQEIHFEDRLKQADLVITGEGAMDNQSLQGKVPVAVAQFAKAQHIPTLAFVGAFNGDEDEFEKVGINVIVPIVDRVMCLEDAIRGAPENLQRSARRVKKIIKMME